MEHDREHLEWEIIMQERVKSLTAKSANGFTHWITIALVEFIYLIAPYYSEHKEMIVEYKLCNN